MCLARADQLRGGRKHTELESSCGVGLLRITGSRRVEQLACRVDGLVLIACGAVAHLTVTGDQDQTGRVGVDGPRHVRRERDGGDQLTGRECSRSARRRRAEPVPPRWIR